MEYYTFKYSDDSTSALLTENVKSGKYHVHSVGFPMLIKTISKPGLGSPNNNGTNLIKISKGLDPAIDVELTESFPSISELQTIVNQAIVDAFPGENDTLLLEQVGLNELRWTNDSLDAWGINYVNVETKQLITGSLIGSLISAFPPGTTSDSFLPDPKLGVSSIILVLKNAFNLTLPASGSYYDQILFYFFNLPVVEVKNSQQARLMVNYSTLDVQKDLISANSSNIQLSIVPI